ncbi:hypothetical protein J6590_002573 [Homalodisca vitripennis]|nr:hypothetical protein J6590_002573 [Homalodisca vitripennis]
MNQVSQHCLFKCLIIKCYLSLHWKQYDIRLMCAGNQENTNKFQIATYSASMGTVDNREGERGLFLGNTLSDPSGATATAGWYDFRFQIFHQIFTFLTSPIIYCV